MLLNDMRVIKLSTFSILFCSEFLLLCNVEKMQFVGSSRVANEADCLITSALITEIFRWDHVLLRVLHRLKYVEIVFDIIFARSGIS